MDSRNLFMSPATYRAVRLEYAAGLIVAAVVTVAHIGHVRWWLFALLFVIIDLIGYAPGAIAWRRADGGAIHPVYHCLYNAMHSLLTGGAIALAWALWIRPEWALLALPIHLFGDRALFGNFLKPFGLSFEPRTHPAYQELVSRYAQSESAARNDRRPSSSTI